MPLSDSESESRDVDESLSQEDEFLEFSEQSDTYVGVIDTSPGEGLQRKHSVTFFNKARYVRISGGTFIGHQEIHYHDAKTGLQTLADAIKDVEDATHDAPPPEQRGCFPRTRRSTLKLMKKWIFDSPSRILWLSGPAGVGKSAIARTLCKEVQRMGVIVGGDFFFSRNRPHKAKFLFPTLAYELAIRVPKDIGDMIVDQVAKDPRISGRDLDIQLSQLILTPLQHFLDPGDWPIVFIIDGLDECENDKTQCKIIEVIRNAIKANPLLPIRFVITSRPEKWIKAEFSSISEVDFFRSVSLEETAETKEDIWKYLAHGFEQIYTKRRHAMREVSRPWPSAPNMKRLVDKASGQFIYASTVLKFVDDDESSPVERLEDVLSIDSQDSVFGAELDSLYTQILKRVKNFARTRDVLAGLLLVSSDAYRDEILSIVEVLFGFHPGDGYSSLTHLHSVLDIREYPKGSAQYAVLIHHKSFVDFLTSKTHSKAFFVDIAAYHARLAIGCTRILMCLTDVTRPRQHDECLAHPGHQTSVSSTNGHHDRLGHEDSMKRPSYIAWDYATMRLAYHCQNSGAPPQDLIMALQELDVSASLLPILLKTEGKTLQEAEPKIRKKLPSRRSRSASTKDLRTADEAIAEAMDYLSTHNLTCSFSIVHEGLLDLRQWLESKDVKCKRLSRLSQEVKIIIKEIHDAQIYRPPRRR